jgi:AmmeMemoRadiSam system protein A
MNLTLEARRQLVTLARHAVVARVSGHQAPSPPDLTLPEAAGVFVSVRIAGHLRGCLGALESRRRLTEDILQCAADAASRDPRFSPLSGDELHALSIEVSVLGAFELCDPPDPSGIIVGVHGLLVERGRRRGLLLPQVAVEWEWDAETFLGQTCVKAGLAPDAWQSGAAVYRFTAEVFGDPAE